MRAEFTLATPDRSILHIVCDVPDMALLYTRGISVLGKILTSPAILNSVRTSISKRVSSASRQLSGQQCGRQGQLYFKISCC